MLIGLTVSPTTARQESDALVLGVSHVGLTVRDLEASAALYRESAHLAEVARGPLEEALVQALAGSGSTVQTRLLASSNVQVRLMQVGAGSATAGRPHDAEASGASEAVPVNGPGMAHLCYQSDGDLETYQKFVARGAQPLGNPELVVLNPRNPVVYAYALDRDGVMFEVEHIDVAAAPERTPPAGFHRIRHLSLATPDMERALAFYPVLLDNPKPRRLGGDQGLQGEPFDQVSGLPGTRIQMAWFQVGNLELEIVHYLSHPPQDPSGPRPLSAPGYNMVVFDVADLDAAKERLRSAGGEPVSETLAIEGGEIFFGRDPDQNLLGFAVLDEESILSSQRFAKP